MPLSDTVTVENSCWSLDFDGVNDYLTTSYTTAFNDITVEAWVKVSQPHSNYMRIVDIDEVFQDYFMFGLDPYGYPTLLLRDDANDPLELTIPQSVVDDQWHHMAWVRNGTQNELYLKTIVMFTLLFAPFVLLLTLDLPTWVQIIFMIIMPIF